MHAYVHNGHADIICACTYEVGTYKFKQCKRCPDAMMLKCKSMVVVGGQQLREGMGMEVGVEVVEGRSWGAPVQNDHPGFEFVR